MLLTVAMIDMAKIRTLNKFMNGTSVLQHFIEDEMSPFNGKMSLLIVNWERRSVPR